jgi:Zn-dependent protease
MRFLTFSKLEIHEIIKAWIGVSLVFAIAMTGLKGSLIISIPIALVTGGIGFLLHEMGHKYVAQKYRCWAEFRANNGALLIGLILSLFGVVLLAPGGVYISGANRSQHGKIALAGPLMNVIIGILFLGMTYVFTQGLMSAVADFGFRINALLGVFNLIPLAPFDGRSILLWSKTAYFSAVLAAGVLMLLSVV